MKGFQPIRHAILSVLFVVAVSHGFGQPFQGGQPPVTEVAAVGMTVADVDRSVLFYSHVLSFKKVSDSYQDSADYGQIENLPDAKARIVRLKLGEEVVELTQYLSTKGRSNPPDSSSNDLWFQHIAVVVSNMQKAYELLKRNGVQAISDRPQRLPRWNKQAADIEAFYFKDPDGHPLELIHFPAGKGDPRWQRKTMQLFLGIDHTAIAASNTDDSVKFYRAVGFEIRGHSLNYGIEQDRLSGVAGARVRITGLRASSGFGIELLEYQNPKTGRPMPVDERASDLVHHQTTLLTTNIHGMIALLCATQLRFVSAGTSCDQPSSWESRRSVLVRDPDGHVLELAAK